MRVWVGVVECVFVYTCVVQMESTVCCECVCM